MHFMKKNHFFLKISLFIAFSSIFSEAYFQKKDAGQEVFAFSSTFQSPRSAAMEFSNAAEPSFDLGITFLNPAGLQLPDGKKTAVQFFWHTGEFAESQGVLSFAKQMETLTFQISYGWITYGSIDGYDEYGKKTGISHEPISQTLALSAMMPFKHLNIGTTIKVPSDKLADDKNDRTAYGLAFDFGISFVSDSKRFGISVLGRDFGTMIRDYTDDGEDEHYAMAETFAVAGFFKPRRIPQLALYTETNFPRYAEPSFHLGAEYSLSQFFFVRAGFSRTWLDLSRDFKDLFLSKSRPSESNEARLFSLGLGYIYKIIALDYSFSYLTSELGLEHRVSLQLSF